MSLRETLSPKKINHTFSRYMSLPTFNPSLPEHARIADTLESRTAPATEVIEAIGAMSKQLRGERRYTEVVDYLLERYNLQNWRLSENEAIRVRRHICFLTGKNLESWAVQSEQFGQPLRLRNRTEGLIVASIAYMAADFEIGIAADYGFKAGDCLSGAGGRYQEMGRRITAKVGGNNVHVIDVNDRSGLALFNHLMRLAGLDGPPVPGGKSKILRPEDMPDDETTRLN